MGDENLLATVRIDVGGDVYVIDMVKQNGAYFLDVLERNGEDYDGPDAYVEFNGQSDDKIAIALGMMNIGFLVLRDIERREREQTH